MCVWESGGVGKLNNAQTPPPQVIFADSSPLRGGMGGNFPHLMQDLPYANLFFKKCKGGGFYESLNPKLGPIPKWKVFRFSNCVK